MVKIGLNCRSYPKNKIGYPFFWNTLYNRVDADSQIF